MPFPFRFPTYRTLPSCDTTVTMHSGLPRVSRPTFERRTDDRLLGRCLNGTPRSRQRSHKILDRPPLRRLWDLGRITEIKEPN